MNFKSGKGLKGYFRRSKKNSEIDTVASSLYKLVDKGGEASEAVTKNNRLIGLYGNELANKGLLERILEGVTYKRVDKGIEHKDVFKLVKEIPDPINGDNMQFGVIVPNKDVAYAFAKRNAITKHKTSKIEPILYNKWKEEDSKNETVDIDEFRRKHLKDYVIRQYGENIFIGSKSDFGLIIPAVYNNGGGGVEKLPRNKVKEIVSKYDSLSMQELNGVYLIKVNKEVSNAKMVGLALAAIAGITFAYNVSQGNVGLDTLVNNPIEFAKSFFQVKYHDVGSMNGYVNQHFDNAQVDGMQIQNAHGDINLHDANVNLDNVAIQNGHGTIGSGTFNVSGTSGEIVYNAGTPYEAHVPVTMEGTTITPSPDNPVELNGFTGELNGNGSITGLNGNVSNISGEITTGTLSGSLNGIFNGTVKIAKYFPSYLFKLGVLGLGALKSAYDHRKIKDNPVNELMGFASDLSTLVKPYDDEIPGLDD